MRSIFVLCVSILVSHVVYSQSFDQRRIALENYLVRMYQSSPFEGVKVVSDYDNTYLLSVVHVQNNGLPVSSMNRIAQVKSQRQTSQFLSGIVISQSETIIRMTESVKDEKTIEEITDIIKEKSVGFTKAMEILTVLDVSNNQKCYMFYRKIEDMNK